MRFIDDVEVAIPIHISERGDPEISPVISVQNPGRRIGIVRPRASSSTWPSRRRRCRGSRPRQYRGCQAYGRAEGRAPADSALARMTVPRDCRPLHRTSVVPCRLPANDDLRVPAALAPEPGIPGEQVRTAIPIHVESIYSFRVPGRAFHIFSRLTGKDGLERPRFGMPGADRYLCQKQRLRLLISEGELRRVRALQADENLIVVLIGPAVVDGVPLPGNPRVEARIGILPPVEAVP